DAIAVVQGYLVADADLRTVDQRAVGRTRIEHGPVAVRRRDQHRVQPADARIGGRSGQVDLRGQAARYAAPPDPHLVPDELETAFGIVGREGDGRAFRPGDRLHLLVVGPVGAHHRGPGGLRIRKRGHRWGGRGRRSRGDRLEGRRRGRRLGRTVAARSGSGRAGTVAAGAGLALAVAAGGGRRRGGRSGGGEAGAD